MFNIQESANGYLTAVPLDRSPTRALVPTARAGPVAIFLSRDTIFDISCTIIFIWISLLKYNVIIYVTEYSCYELHEASLLKLGTYLMFSFIFIAKFIFLPFLN